MIRKRWYIPFIARGASGDRGGHWKVLGVHYYWNIEEWFGYSNNQSLSLFGLVAIGHRDTKGGKLRSTGPAWQITFVRFRNGWPRPADTFL